LQRAPLI